MSQNHPWRISSEDLVSAVQAITTPTQFDVDETVYARDGSYFRFVRASIASFPTIVEFAATLISTTPSPKNLVLDSVRSSVIYPIKPEQVLQEIDSARWLEEHSGCGSTPEWLKFDGEIIDAFEILGRGDFLQDLFYEVCRTSTS